MFYKKDIRGSHRIFFSKNLINCHTSFGKTFKTTLLAASMIEATPHVFRSFVFHSHPCFYLFIDVTSFGEGAVKNNRYSLDSKNVFLKMSVINI
jgi:hypothetical protein